MAETVRSTEEQELLDKYLPEAQGLIAALNELGAKYLEGVEYNSLPLEGSLAETLAYAFATKRNEEERKLLAGNADLSTFSDKCAALGTFLYRVKRAAGEAEDPKIDEAEARIHVFYETLPKTAGLRAGLERARDVIEELLNRCD